MLSTHTLICCLRVCVLPQQKIKGASAVNLPNKKLISPLSLDDIAQSSMRDNGHHFEANEADVYPIHHRRRDEKLAKEDPKEWCADRCLATGYCDILEDIYEMTTAQVQQFCENCKGEDECELAYA